MALHDVILVLLAAATMSAVDAAPGRVAVVRLAPRQDSSEDGVVLVPVAAPPLTLSDDKEGAGEEDGDPWAALAELVAAGGTDSPASPFDSLFSSLESLQSLPAAPRGGTEDDDGGKVMVFRVGRGLKSVPDSIGEIRESRVLEDLEADEGAPEPTVEDVGDDGDPPTAARRHRRALRLTIRSPRGDADDANDADDAVSAAGGQEGRAGRADATPAPGSFLETVQNQLPPQLQGMGGAMEKSQMVVGSFQAIIMPGSAATDLGQQIQGFISNMPQVPQLPAGTG